MNEHMSKNINIEECIEFENVLKIFIYYFFVF